MEIQDNVSKAKDITKCLWFPQKCTEEDIQNMLMEMAQWKDEQRKEDFKRLRAHYQAWADEQINEHRAMLANQNEPNSELFKQWDKATDENIKLRKIIKELVEEAYDIVKNLPENDERLARFKINNILIENHI